MHAELLILYELYCFRRQQPLPKVLNIYIISIYIPEFLKTGLVKIRVHFTTWQLKAIKSVQRPIKKPISDAEQ